MTVLRAGARYLIVISILLLGGCATLLDQKPSLVLSDVRLLPAHGIEPRFELQLRVYNPNQRVLNIAGGAFTLYLQGSRIASGVISGAQNVPAFGDKLIAATGSGDLIGSAVLFHKLRRDRPRGVDYSLQVRLQRSDSYIPLLLNSTGRIGLGATGSERQ